MSASRRTGSPYGRTDPTRVARLYRDAAVERGRSVTKGIAFASVGVVAVAGVYFSQALPGHSASSGSSSGGSVVPSTPAVSPSSGDPNGAQTAPVAAPAPVYNQTPVVSSGSS
jgi:hypothetical protein